MAIAPKDAAVGGDEFADVMTFDEIEAAQGIQYATVPAWGGKKLAVASISAGEILEWLDKREDPKEGKAAGLNMIARSLIGKDKKRLCPDDASMEKMVAILRDKDSKTINAVVSAIAGLNGINDGVAATKNA